MATRNICLLACIAWIGCGPVLNDGPRGSGEGKSDLIGPDGSSGFGAAYDATMSQVNFRVFSSRATRIELDIFAQPIGASAVARFEMKPGASQTFSATVSVADLNALGVTTIYYGYRAWGPNWTYDPSFAPGSAVGFVSDVDPAGNRFNPNKLLFDPYGLELSHDPVGPQQPDGAVYASGDPGRSKDSAPAAPKSIVLAPDGTGIGQQPTRPLKDEIIYEVHLRGLTMQDPDVPASLRGTYAGAAQVAAKVAALGVTAVELLPVQETQNDQNDLATSTSGANYWGYATLGFFAPERRYAADRSPGGPTREFKQMVRAFHDQGLKVYLDVVYNHTGEGYLWGSDPRVANVISYRGLDNATYYELTSDHQFYWDDTGTGGNFNTANDVVRTLIIDSLHYWRNTMGVDGFRFDLASVLGNTCQQGCFQFDKLDPKNALNRAVNELPGRPDQGGSGVDLIAEPWAAGGDGNFQVGGFPWGWAEWNGIYRDTFRKAQNRAGIAPVTPGELATRIAGSSDLYQPNGRKPWHSINFLVAHDGFTQRDLYSYNSKNNNQPWPYGPSDGGSDDNKSWDQGGDPTAQRQAARTGMALLMLSAGVPMLTGGDEMYRTQFGNNNAYNLDSGKNWLNWSDRQTNQPFYDFARRLLAFRRAHPALRPAGFLTGNDNDGNGLKDITWYRDDGGEADGGYMGNSNNQFLAYRIDGGEGGDSVRSIYVAYNGWTGTVTATLPPPAPGRAWYRVSDTASWDEPSGNFRVPGAEDRMDGATYGVSPRSVVVLIEQ
ncbi:MAG TPA: isoamylase [Polyangia bacterium]|nr:isoamylase [Polyangia bacterium]